MESKKYNDSLMDNVYFIPIEDKFILYAPLKPLAFVCNRAMLDRVSDILQKGTRHASAHDDVWSFLTHAGFFKADRLLPAPPKGACDYKPVICILMPTTTCNLRCIYCYASGEKSVRDTLAWPIAKRAIDMVYKNAVELNNGVFTLGFHGGGEPTCVFEFFKKSCRYAKSLNPECVISLTTNGYWPTYQREEILQLVDQVSLSFDGWKKTQNLQRPNARGEETFSRVMTTIKDMDQRKIQYGIRLTVTRQSLPDLVDNIDFLCRQTTCRTFQIEPVYHQGRAIDINAAITDTQQFTVQFMKARQIAGEYSRNAYYSAARPWVVTHEFCTAFSNALIVTTEGELTSCYEVFDRGHDFADDFLFGKIDQTDGCLFYPDKRKHLAAKVADNRLDCKSCFCYYHCAGDCPPKAFLKRKNNDGRRCDITRKITRELLLDRIEKTDGVWRGEKCVYQI